MYYSQKFLEQGKNDIKEETETEDLTDSDSEKNKMLRKENLVFKNGTCKTYSLGIYKNVCQLKSTKLHKKKTYETDEKQLHINDEKELDETDGRNEET